MSTRSSITERLAPRSYASRSYDNNAKRDVERSEYYDEDQINSSNESMNEEELKSKGKGKGFGYYFLALIVVAIIAWIILYFWNPTWLQTDGKRCGGKVLILSLVIALIVTLFMWLYQSNNK